MSRSKLNTSNWGIRVFIAIALSPAYGAIFGYIASENTTNMDAASAFAFFYIFMITTPIAALLIFFVKKQNHQLIVLAPALVGFGILYGVIFLNW